MINVCYWYMYLKNNYNTCVCVLYFQICVLYYEDKTSYWEIKYIFIRMQTMTFVTNVTTGNTQLRQCTTKLTTTQLQIILL